MSNPIWKLLVLFLLTSCQSNSFSNKDFFKKAMTLSEEEPQLTSFINYKKPNLNLLPFMEKNIQHNIVQAVKNNPSMLAFNDQLSQLNADKKGAMALKENKINFRGLGGIVRQDEKNEIGASASLNITRLLYDYGSTNQSIKSIDDSIKSGEFSFLSKVEELALSGYQIVNNLYIQREITSIYDEGIKLAQPLIEQIDNIADSGMADKATILKAKKEFLEIVTEMKKSEAIEKNISAQFVSFFHLKSSSERLYPLKPFSVSNYNSLEKKLLKFSPFLKSQKSNINSLERNLIALKARKKPNLSLNGSLNAPLENTISDSSANLGFVVNYVFNDGGQLDSQIESLENQINAQKKLYKASVYELKQTLKATYDSYTIALETRKTLKELIKISKEVRDTSRSQLVSGRTKLQDVLTSEVSLAKNKIMLINTEGQINTYSFILRSLTSGLLPNVKWF